ncbi:MAG: basic amino acid ABC transporter substrate-binding protein, partial [Actinomycetota bacterium]|nr:basic amino acid ABC transporter substrate-binding protein [Actinomycetota bacterium]
GREREGEFRVSRRSRSHFPEVLILAVGVAVALILLVGCSAGTDNKSFEGASPGETTTSAGAVGGKITVASNMAYPPFESSPKGEPKGFDIDLMNEIANRAGFKVEYENVQFDSILRGLDAQLFDAAISAMTITKEREQQLDFSDPYFNADQALLVASYSDVHSIDGLREATVGVQAGSTGQIKAEELLNDDQIREIKPYRTIGKAFAALEAGEVDGVIYDLSAAHEEIVDSGGEIRFVESIPTGEQYGIAFPEDSALVAPVNQALAEIKDDGTYEKLYKKWIGMPPEEIP